MPDEDRLVVIASYLRPEEAGMLRGLLESAGITATVLNDVLLSHHPWAAGGVAKLAVFQPDAERALEIIRSAGVLPGAGPDEPVEIPEEEWSRAPEAKPGRALTRPPATRSPAVRPRATWPRRVVIVTLLALILLLLRCSLALPPPP